jgi:hypothetical protein
MRASVFRRIVTKDTADLLEKFISFLEARGLRYCVIDAQAVNAYVEPLVSLDLDLVVALVGVPDAAEALQREFQPVAHAHSMNISQPGSDLRVQIQTDPRYLAFIDRAGKRDVLGRSMYVASLEDVVQGKVWAVLDSQRRGSKRQKDLADISRILEAVPALRARVPDAILQRLL